MKSTKSQTLYQFRLKHGVFARLLARNNMSQNQLARKVGISSSFMSQILSGERHAGPKTRKLILAALPGSTFDQLFEEIVSAESTGQRDA